MLLDVATAVALGGACLADVVVVRSQPELFGPVASDPTVSRLISTLAADRGVVAGDPDGSGAGSGRAVWARRRPLAGTPGKPGWWVLGP